MRRHSGTRWTRTAALAALLVPAALPAGAQDPHAMHGGMEMAAPQEMPAGCKELMAQRDEMKAKAAAMDERLDALVAEMNAAEGKEKTAAMAKVLTELVAQRKEMREMMMCGQPMMMMGHMMERMGKEMMPGAMHSMEGCPMMQQMQEKPEAGGGSPHAGHHPDGR